MLGRAFEAVWFSVMPKDTSAGGTGDRTTDYMISGQAAVDPQLQLPQHHCFKKVPVLFVQATKTMKLKSFQTKMGSAAFPKVLR